MTDIKTLIPDIYSLVSKKDGWFDADLARRVSDGISVRLMHHWGKEGRPTLRLSQMGPRCPRQLWYSIHHPELREPLPPWAQIKYAFGHVLEALFVEYARAAGHEVTGEQDELILDGIVGHRDGVVDGCVVDFKSCSTMAFQKIKRHGLEQDDSFGYLDQLDGYVVASADDPLVRVKDKGYIFAIDKTLGHCCLHEHRIREDSIRSRIRENKRIVSLSDPPECNCPTKSEGKSGNVILDTKASYSAFKYCCFPNLRTFIFSDGPKYFSKVNKVPTNQYGPLPEVDRYGKVVYN